MKENLETNFINYLKENFKKYTGQYHLNTKRIIEVILKRILYLQEKKLHFLLD